LLKWQSVRATLVNALSTCAAERLRDNAIHFLEGLSADELQYIADFVGACILEDGLAPEEGLDAFARYRAGARTSDDGGILSDQEHKMVLLLEYLCRCGHKRLAPA
jgi:hypothetical protein